MKQKKKMMKHGFKPNTVPSGVLEITAIVTSYSRTGIPRTDLLQLQLAPLADTIRAEAAQQIATNYESETGRYVGHLALYRGHFAKKIPAINGESDLKRVQKQYKDNLWFEVGGVADVAIA